MVQIPATLSPLFRSHSPLRYTDMPPSTVNAHPVRKACLIGCCVERGMQATSSGRNQSADWLPLLESFARRRRVRGCFDSIRQRWSLDRSGADVDGPDFFRSVIERYGSGQGHYPTLRCRIDGPVDDSIVPATESHVQNHAPP